MTKKAPASKKSFTETIQDLLESERHETDTSLKKDDGDGDGGDGDGGDGDGDFDDDTDDVEGDEAESLDEISNEKKSRYVDKAMDWMDKKDRKTSKELGVDLDNTSLSRSRDARKVAVNKNMKDPKYSKRWDTINKTLGKLGENELTNEDAASDNLASVATKPTKTNSLNQALGLIASMSGDDITQLVAVLQQNSQTFAASIPPNAAAKNNASVEMAASKALKEAINEDLYKIFGDDQTLSEEFKNNVSMLFETAVSARVSLIESDLHEKFEARLNEEVSSITETVINKMDEYFNYVAKQWLEENRLAVENGLKTEITENFIGGLRNLFLENYMDIPEDKIDVIEALTNENEELAGRMNEVIDENVELTNAMLSLQKDMTIMEVARGMSVMDQRKLATLAEDVEFTDRDTFIPKMKLLSERMLGKTAVKKPNSRILTEEIMHEGGRDDNEVSPQIQNLMDAISNTIRKY